VVHDKNVDQTNSAGAEDDSIELCILSKGVFEFVVGFMVAGIRVFA
jgi:hypothetical protein